MTSQLETLAGEFRNELEGDLGLADPERNFADVLHRVRASSPHLVPGDELEELEARATVHRLESPPQAAADPALAELATELRGVIEDDLRERALHPAPPVDCLRAASSPNTGPWLLMAVGALATAAAVTLVWVGAATTMSTEPIRTQAEHLEAKPDPEHARLVEPRSAPRLIAPRRPQAAEVRVPKADPTPRASSDPTKPDPAKPDPAKPDPVRPEVEKPGPPDPLALLANQAQQKWRARDYAGAEALFREVIERGGKGRQADLAHGDLFALVRQARGPDALPAEWSAYLVRFPEGRFADDARAGVCRSARGPAERRCWTDYLAEHPHGSHAALARRRLEDGGEG